MRMPKKRCYCCGCWFSPHPRTVAIQKFCSRPKCRQESRLRSHRAWWRVNGPSTNAARRAKVRLWAQKNNYWQRYRATRPKYTRRDNRRRWSARRRVPRAAKQDTIRQISVNKLRDIAAFPPDRAAKQDTILRRVDGILDYLLWKEESAKQDAMALAGAPA